MCVENIQITSINIQITPIGLNQLSTMITRDICITVIDCYIFYEEILQGAREVSSDNTYTYVHTWTVACCGVTPYI